MARLIRDWRVLDTEQRRALGAAVALFVTMLLPWYQQNGFIRTRSAEVRADTHNLTAFGAFSFVEAAVLLVALAVAYLVFARAEGRDFQVPGSDGAVVFAAGIWTVLLLVYRLFDKPSISHGTAANVGVQWGIFFALAAAGLLAYTGSRMRAASRLDGGHPGAGPRVERPGRHRDRHRDPDFDRRPDHGPGSGRDPDRDPGRDRAPVPARPRREAAPRDEQLTTVHPGRASNGAPGPAPQGETVAGRSRPRYPPPPPGSAEQMSFDDAPPEDA